MTTSALLPLANATVSFRVAGDGVLTDPDTGNVYPAWTEIQYSAFLKAVNVDPAVYPGVDATGLVYEGYVVSPQNLDARVGIGSTGTLSFGTAQSVEFEVLRSRLGYGDQGALGTPLSTLLGTKITLLSKG